MKAKSLCLSLTVITLTVTFALALRGASYAQSPAVTIAPREFVKGEVIVELQPGVAIDGINAHFGTTTKQRLYGTNFYLLRTLNGKKEAKWRKRLAKDARVLSAALNPVITNPGVFGRSTASFPDGYATVGLTEAEFAAQQELFAMLKLDEVRLRSRGAGVTVAVIDTGVDHRHPLLAARLWNDARNTGDLPGNGIDDDRDGLVDDWAGWDFVDNDNDPAEHWEDPTETVAGHGTFIAGLIAVLAPDSRILPVRAFPSSGIADAFTVATAVKYAADHGADVINLSLGSTEPSELLREAIAEAQRRGIVVVAAVGNDDSEVLPQFPASLNEVLAVAAIDFQSKKALFSNFGSHVDVSAPGVKLISAFPGGNLGAASYAEWSGTSFAAPLAAAEAALLLAYDPRQSDINSIIKASAAPIDADNPAFLHKLGSGRIDPLLALQSLRANPGTQPVTAVYSETEMTATDVLPGARGKASLRITETALGARQEFHVEAHNLSARTSYQLYIDGKPVGSESADGRDSASLGALRFHFSTDTLLPAALNPVTQVRHVELRAERGQRVVLQGSFQFDGGARRFLEKAAPLVPVTAIARLGGVARVKVLGDYQELKIEVEGLPTNASYQLIVDGIALGARAAPSGFIRALLATNGSGEQGLPLALLPVTNIRRVEVRDGRGEIILRGDFAVVGAPSVSR